MFHSYAQENKYLVFLKDKAGTSFNPYEYFDQKAIDRRIKSGISLYDPTDFPLNQNYVTQISNQADSTGYQLRWFNAVEIWASQNEINSIQKLSFVNKILPITNSQKEIAIYGKPYDFALDSFGEALLKEQLEIMQGDQYKQNNIDGKGIRIAIFDAGFPTADVNPAFEHLRKNNKIIKTWDFVCNHEKVYGHNSHGLMTFSCVAGIVDGQNIGLATGSEFLLARTETWTEPFSEELNWMAAVEWADKNGADIISSSLGYTDNRYFKKDMDGITSYVTRAGNLAARKGILVVNAMGNDYDSDWRTLGAPADADSVLSIGGIDPFYNYHIYFSSVGPTYDGRLKPNVSAYGEVIAAGKKQLQDVFGTSFATPLVAGFAACAWQTNPDMTNMELFKALEKSGDLYPYFDYAHGYGIPQASYFVSNNVKEVTESFHFSDMDNDNSLSINIDIPIDSTLKDNNLFYKELDDQDRIIAYYVVEVRQPDIKLWLNQNTKTLVVFYKDTYKSKTLK